MIWSCASFGTGKVFGLGSEVVKLALTAADSGEAGEEEATRVESAPWVMRTSRGREALDLGRLAIDEAIWPIDESC